MLNYALVLFAIGALGGLFMATKVLRGKFAPWALSVVHALLGAAGLVVLIVMLVQGATGSRLTAALALLVAAALGGFFLASQHLGKRIPAKGIVIGHAGLAVIGFLTLLSIALF